MLGDREGQQTEEFWIGLLACRYMLLLSYKNKGILSCPTFDILWNLSLWYLPLSILVTASGTTRARKGRKDMMAARDMNWVMRSTHSYTWLYTKFDSVSHKI